LALTGNRLLLWQQMWQYYLV